MKKWLELFISGVFILSGSLALGEPQTHVIHEKFEGCHYQGYYGIVQNTCAGIVNCLSEAGKLRYTGCPSVADRFGKTGCPDATECANDTVSAASPENVQTYLCEMIDESEKIVLPRPGCRLDAQNYHEASAPIVTQNNVRPNSISPSGAKTGQAIAR